MGVMTSESVVLKKVFTDILTNMKKNVGWIKNRFMHKKNK